MDKKVQISDIINSNISIANELLNKRIKFLKRFSEKEKQRGYEGLNNLRIDSNSILFNNDIQDCRYDDKTFYVTGREGEEEIELKSINFLRETKKAAREVNCGGLK